MHQDEVWLLKEKYHGEKTEGFFADCARLQQGEPLAYIIGSIPFLNTTIWLDSHPLIPRVETEFWVERIIQRMHEDAHGADVRPVRVLDLCAGSGCIGVAVAKAFPAAHVDFAEIDTRHHATILKNITENGIDPLHTTIYDGDLFSEVVGRYDYILANPPYIDETLGRTEESVLMHEPHTALFAEDGGFALVERIMRNAATYLAPEGTIVIEHEPEQLARITAQSVLCGFARETLPDQYGHDRYTILTRTAEEFMSS